MCCTFVFLSCVRLAVNVSCNVPPTGLFDDVDVDVDVDVVRKESITMRRCCRNCVDKMRS